MVTISPTSSEVANFSMVRRTIAGVHSRLAFKEAAALKLVIVQAGPGNLSTLSEMLYCDSSCSGNKI